jgi:hypothetical protein
MLYNPARRSTTEQNTLRPLARKRIRISMIRPDRNASSWRTRKRGPPAVT